MVVLRPLSFDDSHFFTRLRGRVQRTEGHPQTGGVGLSLPAIDLAVSHDNGYVRRQCRITNLWFWTNDESRTTCGDTHEDEYTFIGKPLIAGFEQRGGLERCHEGSIPILFQAYDHHRVEPHPVLPVGEMISI